MLVAPESGSDVGGRLIYPMIMMFVGSAIIVFLVAYVVPQVAAIFVEQHADLPVATKLLIRFSALVTDHWLMAAIPIIVFIAGVVVALTTARGRRFYHYCDHQYSRHMNNVMEPVITLTMAVVIVLMMLAVLMPIFQLDQLIH
jgi:type II secretory pathway component PulF